MPGTSHRTTFLAAASVLVGLAGLLSACGSGSPSQPVSTPTTSPLPASTTTTAPHRFVTTTTTTTLPPSSIPATITTGYVNGILAQLDGVQGDAIRSSASAGQVTPAAHTELASIYTPGELGAALVALGATVQGRRTKLRPTIGNPVTTVAQLVGADPGCIFARVTVDEAAVERHPPAAAGSTYEELRRTRRPIAPNPTPWQYSLVVTSPPGTPVPDQCGQTP